MALPVIAVEEEIADELVATIAELAKERKIGPAYEKDTDMGPLVNEGHKEFVLNWIDKSVAEGAKLVLDGRDLKVEGFENGFFVGPTVFDFVTPEMECGNREVFGPVLYVKRVKNFDEGVELINSSDFANGASIFTQSGYYAREFARRIDAGMVGVNVGIPVPISVFPFIGPQEQLLRRPARDGSRRSDVLHRDQGGHQLLVRRGSPQGRQGRYLGRDHHPHLRDDSNHRHGPPPPRGNDPGSRTTFDA